MTDLSVIIVNWNAGRFLVECLKSLRARLDHVQSEIVVVDNASTDGSAAVVRGTFPDVRLIENDRNLGFAKANNLGIVRSQGRYICLVNPDISIRGQCIEGMLSYMEQHPEIGILGPRILNPDLTLQHSCRGFPSLWNQFCRALALDSLFPRINLFGGHLMTFWSHDEVRPVDVLSGCFWMVRRAAIKEVDLLDEDFFMYAEDTDWCKRFWAKGWEVVYFPKAEVIHYGGACSSHASVRFHLEMLRSNFHYWKKHHGRAAQLGFCLIALLHQAVRLVQEASLYVVQPSRREELSEKVRGSIVCGRWLLGLVTWHS